MRGVYLKEVVDMIQTRADLVKITVLLGSAYFGIAVWLNF